MKPGFAFTAFNVVGFQAVWFCCVAGAGRGLLWPGLLAAAIFAVLVLAFGGRRRDDLRTLAWVLPLGIALDSAFSASGWLVYVLPLPWVQVAPAWIVALWLGFSLTLNHSLAFLRDHPGWSALFGLVGGPLAYVASANVFAAVSFGASPTQVLCGLALAWALFLPLVFSLIRTAPPTTAAAAT